LYKKCSIFCTKCQLLFIQKCRLFIHRVYITLFRFKSPKYWSVNFLC
jgi:hypothetical protein